jgi:hypothetical protein
LALVVLIDFADLGLGMVMLHAFTFDPAWIGSRTLRRGRHAARACRSLPGVAT